jgi:hypothetical protein
MKSLVTSVRSARKYRGYLPQPVTMFRVLRWLWQFKRSDRKDIGRLLDSILYLSEHLVRKILVDQNAALMERLAMFGVPPENIIYVQVDEAGSSSGVMLNMLRDAAGLQQRGCNFLDSNDVLGINRLTNKLGSGALVYIDDFVGTGMQFCSSRDFAAQNVVGSFSEFLLVPCICEEGISEIAKRGVEPYAGHVHSKAERPLHDNSAILDRATKRRLIEVCERIDPTIGVGFLGSAAMVVLYRNAPDNIPIIFRGNEKQEPFFGIFPRTTDLPLQDPS